jgi:hypothetical protein
VAVRDHSGGVEESGLDFVDSKILFEPSFDNVPIDDLNNLVSFIHKFDLVHTEVGPVVSLGDIGFVVIVADVVLVIKDVSGVNPSFLCG